MKNQRFNESSYLPVYRTESVKSFKKVAFIICAFVMMREFRPVEPFFTSYLTSPPLNFTHQEVNEKIYPIGTFASFFFVIIIFLVTDYLKYKPIIILDGITGIFTYALLFGSPTLMTFYTEQLFFGFFYSSDVASNTYLYAKFEDPSLFQKITGYVRASSLFGRFVSGVFSQVTISFNLLQKTDLVYCSTIGMVLVTLWAFIIPPVDHSIYFHKVEKQVTKNESALYQSNSECGNNDVQSSVEQKNISTVVKTQKCSAVLKELWLDFKTAYTNMYVLKWSLWWAFALCGYFFVATYSQVLWQMIADEYGGNQYLMNGAIESIYTITSAVSAYLIGGFNFNWRMYGDGILIIVSFIFSALLLFSYLCYSLWFIYLAYIIYGMVFQTMFTIAQSEVAMHLKRDSYALIFGFNLFVSLGIGSIITYTIIEGNLIRFTTRQQFLFYAAYYFVIGSMFLIKVIISFIRYYFYVDNTK